MDRIRLPLAAFVLVVLAACQSAAPTAPVAPRQPGASIDSVLVNEAARGGNLFGSGH
ncbi:MAG: hypothetical protein ABW277_27485 [Longimicrobiaceae bacterium]